MSKPGRLALNATKGAAPFSSKTVVAYCVDRRSPVDKGEFGPSRQPQAETQVHHGRIQSRLQHLFEVLVAIVSPIIHFIR
jgi:hypothetical protein